MRPSFVACFLVTLVLTLLIAGLALTEAHASGSDTKEEPKNTADSLYNEGVKLAEEGRHAAARVKFEEAHELKSDDADILNMLAFTMRKTGDLEQAFEVYQRALAQRDQFPQAREYLGEAHIQAALIQIQTLRSYGPEGEQELASLLDVLKRAANQAAGTDFEVEAANW